jgi:hypothetical protein
MVDVWFETQHDINNAEDAQNDLFLLGDVNTSAADWVSVTDGTSTVPDAATIMNDIAETPIPDAGLDMIDDTSNIGW